MDRNPFFCPDAAAAARWEGLLASVRKAGSSIGAVIELVADGVPPGLGAPIYGKLDAAIAAALMGINAVKGVEIGEGFAAAERRGEENADAMHREGGSHRVRQQSRWRNPGRHLDRAAPSWRASRSSRPVPSSPQSLRWTSMGGTFQSPPRAGMTPVSASAPFQSAKRCWPVCWPIICCGTADRMAVSARLI